MAIGNSQGDKNATGMIDPDETRIRNNIQGLLAAIIGMRRVFRSPFFLSPGALAMRVLQGVGNTLGQRVSGFANGYLDTQIS